MPEFICAECGTTFTLSQHVIDRYPGWTPRTCRSCRDKASGAAPRRSGGGAKRAASGHEDLLTLDEVLARYSAGPTTGVFTDGSSVPNPGPGGWGAVYVVADAVVARDHGHEDDTTNNRMELTALIAGAGLVPESTPAVLYTDSRLAAQTINEWAPGWERRGWKRKTGPISNLDLVQRLYRIVRSRPELQIEWVPAHSGYRWNEYADALSTAWRRHTL
jgi:ribonuclease HI